MSIIGLYLYYRYSVKSLERYKRMYSFLTKNKLIYEKRFGFRFNYSTNHALISLTEKLRNYLDSSHFVAGVFVDLEKTFDTVNHK